ncbi:MAG TPA: DUF6345 domain-containing protein [Verrucomicrobiota bacterium]|nr:hypothetical protein [Verrucomicrobiota bacterium]HRR65108.1 DUF6345 domain-containing protein [Candidatus Paceibacterota bacterium]HOF71272.1 DUF6345 domain-containing protein [Verrucomicrobiota bacterium]HOM45811.1 DUF6345 domain-containing protein [Verrucomicrobiota bacterium]HOQ56458.1 DUF6345 domain-containing protein [Verrucomicrobiota bacterium]
MKSLKSTIGKLAVGCVFGLSLISSAPAQLQFTDVRVNSGGAIQLYWASESNAVYRIEYASELIDSGTIWNMLYEDYPSFGTNTYWTDAGDQNTADVVGHPRDGAMRFYRVVQTDTNDLANAPQVSILTPTNNSVLTGDITVSLSVTSSLPVNSIRLYVDGQEVGYQVDEATNFVINTCQLGNGSHKIFAIVENSSGSETTGETADMVANYGISPARSVIFDNFITDYRGKLRFQDPDESETNRFSANFAAYADWTLTITNQNGVAVRTVTGTDFSMEFVWDGTGDGGTNLPNGPYWAVLSATQSSSSSMAELLRMMPSYIEDAIAKGEKSYFIEPPPMPPVYTNGEWVSWEKVYGPQPLTEVPIQDEYFTLAAAIDQQAKEYSGSSGGGVTLDGPGDSGSGSQTTVLRPIPSVWFGKNGTVGIAYQGNHPDGVSFGLNTRPSNGLLGRVSLNVTPGSYGHLNAAHRIALGFNRYMGGAGYRLKFYKGNFDLQASDLRKPSKGGSSRFNDVNVGLLVGHGVYGTTADYTIAGSGPLQTYYPVYAGGNGYDWVRLSEFDFGSSGANGLRWMSILTCNNLVNSVYQDCYDKEVLPVNDYLHLLCGAKTSVFIVSAFGLHYSAALTGGGGVQRRTVKESWFYAGTKTQGFQPGGPHVTVQFRVIGWPACFTDDLVTYSDPDSGNPADITFEDSTVFTP